MEYCHLRGKIRNANSEIDGITQEMLTKELVVNIRTVSRRENYEIKVTNEALLALRYIVEMSKQKKAAARANSSNS